MARDRSSEGVSGACPEDIPEEKQIGVWVWEYILKFTSDVSLIRELTESLPFPEGVPRLQQMLLIKALSFQASKDLDIEATLGCLEALQQSFEGPHLGESEDVALSKQSKPSSSTANGDGSLWKELRQPTLELTEGLRKLLSKEADVQNVTGIMSKLSALIKNSWALFGPVYLERVEAAVINGKYKPQGVSIPLPLAENGGPVDDRGAKTSNQDSAVELQNVVNAVTGRNETLNRAHQALVDNCVEMEKLVKDPLPELLRKPDGGVPGVGKRSLLDPHPSAQAQVWDEEDEIEDSASPMTPSASKRIRLPPLRSPDRQPVLSPVAVQVAVMKKRRAKKKWSEEEVEVLKREVEKYGKGHWKMILLQNKEVLQGRTEVDIKDKWRNLEKYSLV